ncbi:GNAT family N-acetyltransferase [Gemmatimonas groenlandica]|uniref:GNAT family N-acetyltransferase n=1 Tax=Gemmatimonas groenlandica TaxID=2732249 RepID=A0A6M4IT00_9BACT|nr:GNAT family N-acetyltransferase [Gemmatimonas groenlandica]QJR37863.1 GNAT family N-acetyltransferase [Gemmatimonas groenlandica]
MPFATRHRDDPMPLLRPLPTLHVTTEADAGVMAQLQGRPIDDISRRFDAGHRAYVATLGDIPAAWGWVATRTAEIGEVGANFLIPASERYLWNFVTLAAHRGRGIYPQLLQAIVRAESIDAERFWIAYAPENHASGAGIAKAGFHALAEMSFDADGRPALRATVEGGAAIASRVLGLRETSESLTPCWRCVRAGRTGMTCAPGSCRCDYQRTEVACAD